jgi:SHS2 domain-containing protein
MYETFEHIVDIGIRGYGKTLEESFCCCAKALFSVLFENFDSIKPEREIVLDIESVSIEGLLIKWLNKLISVSDIENIVFSDCEIKIDDFHLHSTMKGAILEKHKFVKGTEVKGATFCEAKVIKNDKQFIAQCVIDV